MADQAKAPLRLVETGPGAFSLTWFPIASGIGITTDEVFAAIDSYAGITPRHVHVERGDVESYFLSGPNKFRAFIPFAGHQNRSANARDKG